VEAAVLVDGVGAAVTVVVPVYATAETVTVGAAVNFGSPAQFWAAIAVVV